METRTYIIENPYEHRLVAEIPEYKDGRTKRREKRAKKTKNKFGIVK